MEKDKLVALVKGAQQGDESAVSELYQAYWSDLYYFILKNVNNDNQLAEDLVQDAFIEILQTIEKLEEPAAFPTWSQRIAYHKCTAYFRKRHELLADENEDGQTVFDTIEEDRTEFIPDEALDKEDLRQTILAMVNDLPEEQRAAIVLRYYNEASVAQIAQVQGVSEGTVKSRLNYGRKAIAQAVKDYETKSGIKLRCVGIVPLLLWLFRQQAVAAGVSITTKAAATAAVTATATASTSSAAAVTTGAKVAGKLALKKIIAGVAAAAVVGGGITAGVLLSRNEPQEPKEAKPMTWYGYAEMGVEDLFDVHTSWMDLDIDQMSDTKISGTIVVTKENKVVHEAHFEGEGQVQEPEETQATEETKVIDAMASKGKGSVIYEITFDQPVVVSTILGDVEYTQETLIYEKDTDTFVIENFCSYLGRVQMVRTGSENPETLVKNKVYVGDGYNGFLDMGYSKYSFRFQVEEITSIYMKGTLTVYVGEEVYHESVVSGRGFLHNENYFYHLAFETPKPTDSEWDINDFLMVLYHPGEDTIYVLDSFNDEMYKFNLFPE